MAPKHRALLGQVLGIALVVVVVLVVKVLVSSRGELELAERAEAAGELDAAITHYRRAARWHLVVQPYADDALERLMAIGERAEADGDAALALASYRSAHAAIMAGRSVLVTDRALLARADARIAHLMATHDVPAVDRARGTDEREATYLEMLETDRDPALGWALLALLGFVLWVLGAYAIFTRALDADDQFVERELRRWGTVFVLGLGLFALGLALA